MNREEFLKNLGALAESAKSSSDLEVSQCAVVLLGLRGAFRAGGDFLEAYVEQNAFLIKNQRDLLEKLLKQK